MIEPDKTREIIAKVREIEIRTRRLVDEAMAGHYESVFKGRGMDFDRVRDYVRGDEIRTIDWNVTARTGTPHVKVFTEERELTMMLMIDVSASSDFGSNPQTKRELAAEVASVMAFSAIRNNDKVGLILFTDEIELYLPPASGRRHILRLIREILFFQPKGTGTDLAAALDFANRGPDTQGSDVPALGFLPGRGFPSSGRQSATEIALDRPAPRPDRRRRERPPGGGLPDIGILHIEDAETGEIVAHRYRSRDRSASRSPAGRTSSESCCGARSAAMRHRLARTAHRRGLLATHSTNSSKPANAASHHEPPLAPPTPPRTA